MLVSFPFCLLFSPPKSAMTCRIVQEIGPCTLTHYPCLMPRETPMPSTALGLRLPPLHGSLHCVLLANKPKPGSHPSSLKGRRRRRSSQPCHEVRPVVERNFALIERNEQQQAQLSVLNIGHESSDRANLANDHLAMRLGFLCFPSLYLVPFLPSKGQQRTPHTSQQLEN